MQGTSEETAHTVGSALANGPDLFLKQSGPFYTGGIARATKKKPKSHLVWYSDANLGFTYGKFDARACKLAQTDLQKHPTTTRQHMEVTAGARVAPTRKQTPESHAVHHASPSRARWPYSVPHTAPL